MRCIIVDMDGHPTDEVARLVADARRSAGLTQAQLAVRAGTSQAAISRIERGLESPTVDRLAQLLTVAGRTLTFAAPGLAPPRDPADLRAERDLTADERLAQGIELSVFAAELAGAVETAGDDG